MSLTKVEVIHPRFRETNNSVSSKTSIHSSVTHQRHHYETIKPKHSQPTYTRLSSINWNRWSQSDGSKTTGIENPSHWNRKRSKIVPDEKNHSYHSSSFSPREEKEALIAFVGHVLSHLFAMYIAPDESKLFPEKQKEKEEILNRDSLHSKNKKSILDFIPSNDSLVDTEQFIYVENPLRSKTMRERPTIEKEKISLIRSVSQFKRMARKIIENSRVEPSCAITGLVYLEKVLQKTFRRVEYQNAFEMNVNYQCQIHQFHPDDDNDNESLLPDDSNENESSSSSSSILSSLSFMRKQSTTKQNQSNAIVRYFSILDDLENDLSDDRFLGFIQIYAVCVTVASKVIEDRFINNMLWSVLIGDELDLNGIAISSIERQILNHMNFEMMIPLNSLLSYVTQCYRSVSKLKEMPLWHFDALNNSYLNGKM